MTLPAVAPVLDAGRGTLTLPRRLLPVAMMLRRRGDVADDVDTLRALRELERAGIAFGGRLHPMAAHMLTVVTAPKLVITVEVTVSRRTEISTIWAAEGRAVLGAPVEPGAFQLSPLDADLLPFHLTDLTRVGARPDPPFRGTVAAPADLLDELEDLWRRDTSRAVERLRGAGVDDAWADRLAIAHHHRRSLWRVAALWVGEQQTANDAELTVLDAGSAGYWSVTPSGGAEPSITFSVLTVDEVLEALRRVIPPHWRSVE